MKHIYYQQLLRLICEHPERHFSAYQAICRWHPKEEEEYDLKYPSNNSVGTD